MILLLASLAFATLPQESAEQRPSGQMAAAWWEQLSEDQRGRLNERWRKYREYGPESQEILRKRFDTLEDERSMLFRRLSEEERQRFEAMDDAERRRFLDERLRERFRARSEHWRGRDPGLAEGLRDLPPEECSRRLEGLAREVHSDRVRGELERAVSDGWVGPAAAEWLRQAPAEELFTAIGQVHRWRFLERAQREGFWELHGIGPQERSRMLELPIPHFFEEVRRVQGGEPLLAPPCDWRRERAPRGFDRREGGGPREHPEAGRGERPPTSPQR